MQSIINEAIQSTHDVSAPPPTKKRKVSVEQVPIIEEEECTEDQLIARKQLVRLHLKHPGLDTSDVEEVHDRVSQLTNDQVSLELERVKSHLNTSLPGLSSHGFLGLFGLVLDKLFGVHGLGGDFVNDPELTILVEHIMPNIDESVSVPVRILHRVMDNVVKKRLEK